MGKSYKRSSNPDFAYCEKKSHKSKQKTKFTKAVKSLADVESMDEEDLDEFFDEPDM